MQRETVSNLSYKEPSQQSKDLIRLKIYFFCLRSKVNPHNSLLSLIVFMACLFAFNSFCICVQLLIAQITGDRIKLIKWLLSADAVTGSFMKKKSFQKVIYSCARQPYTHVIHPSFTHTSTHYQYRTLVVVFISICYFPAS